MFSRVTRGDAEAAETTRALESSLSCCCLIGRAAPTAVCVTGRGVDFAPGPRGHVHELRPHCRGRHVLEEKEGKEGRQAGGGGESSSESAKWEEGEITQRMSTVILAGG